MEKSRKTWILIFVILVYLGNITAQNLVPNPSFEEYMVCPKTFTETPAKELLPGWLMPTKGTSDYFNACSKLNVSVPVNFMGSMFAINGNAYVGTILLEHPKAAEEGDKPLDYREYLQCKLNEILVKDSLYIVSLFYCVAPNSTYSINSLGIALTNKKVGGGSKEINLVPTILSDTSVFPHETDKWMLLCDTIKALGNEKYLTLGNFRDDENTQYYKLVHEGKRSSLLQKIEDNQLAYYYFDLISVLPLYPD